MVMNVLKKYPPQKIAVRINIGLRVCCTNCVNYPARDLMYMSFQYLKWSQECKSDTKKLAIRAESGLLRNQLFALLC